MAVQFESYSMKSSLLLSLPQICQMQYRRTDTAERDSNLSTERSNAAAGLATLGE